MPCAAPFNPAIAIGPVELALDGLHVAPINRHPRHVEGGEELPRGGVVHFHAAELAAKQRGEAARRAAAAGDRLIGIRGREQLARVQGQTQRFLRGAAIVRLRINDRLREL